MQDQRIVTNELVPLTSYNKLLDELEDLKMKLELNPKLEELRSDLADLETKVTSLTTNPDFDNQIENRFDNIMSEINTIKNKCAEADKLTNKLIPKASFDTLSQEVETLKTSLNGMQSNYELEELKSDFEDLETSINDLEVQLSSLVASQEDGSEITELEENIADLQTKFQEIKTLYDDDKDGMTNMLKEIKENKAKIDGSIRELEDLKSLVNDLKTPSQSDASDIVELQTKLQEIQTIATNTDKLSKENLKQVNSSIQQIKSLYDNVNNAMTNMHTEMDDNTVKIDGSNLKLEELKKSVQDLEKQLSALAASQIDVSEITDLETKFQEVEAIATGADKQTKENLKQISQSVQRINAVYTDVQGQIGNLQTQLDALESQPDKNRISDLETEINTLKVQPQDNKDKINDLQRQLDTLKPKPDDNKAKIDGMETKVQENLTYIQHLDQNIITTNNNINTLYDEHLALIKENQDKLKELQKLDVLIEKNKRDIKSHRTIIQVYGFQHENYEADGPKTFTTGYNYYRFFKSCTLKKVIVSRPPELSYVLEKWDNKEANSIKQIHNGTLIPDDDRNIFTEVVHLNESISDRNCIAFVPKINLPYSPTTPALYMEFHICF
jgi:chromosome segregation ATPase